MVSDANPDGGSATAAAVAGLVVFFRFQVCLGYTRLCRTLSKCLLDPSTQIAAMVRADSIGNLAVQNDQLPPVLVTEPDGEFIELT